MKRIFFLLLAISMTFFFACQKDDSFIKEVSATKISSDIIPDIEVSAGHFPGQPREYIASLSMLNSSGVSGEVRIKIFSDQVSVKVTASGAEANQVHAQHVHGMSDPNINATCPDMSADTNNDGLIDLVEGLPFYGGVVLSLEQFPTANANGMINYNRMLPWDALTPITTLDNRTIVLHGMTVNGTYIGSLPIACGELVRIQ